MYSTIFIIISLYAYGEIIFGMNSAKKECFGVEVERCFRFAFQVSLTFYIIENCP